MNLSLTNYLYMQLGGAMLHRFLATSMVMIGLAISALAQDKRESKKDAPGKDEPRKGTVTGVVTAKGDNFIEVKADGEEKGRKYIPHWVGGAPAKGGGPDKAMVAEIKKTPLKARVRIEWEFEEHFRVLKIDVLKAPDSK